MDEKKLVLIILDGWGLAKPGKGNAISLAKTPNFTKFWETYPHLSLQASGLFVGLPEGQMGTSEVNHAIIGAGRVIFQDLVRINNAIQDGSFYKNKAFIDAFDHVKKNNSFLHIFGLVSDGGVHSHLEHIYALIRDAKEHGVSKVYIHAFTDGRDTSPKGGLGFVTKLQEEADKIGVGKVASICGRYFAMDRDHNWERTDKAYRLSTKGEGEHFPTINRVFETSYEKKITDEFIEPSFIGAENEGIVKENDAIIFANFRNDRPRQITERFLELGPENVFFVTMTQYSPEYKVAVAFPPIEVKNSLGEVISNAHLKQVRITETEKFAHLTFFMNCKRENPFEGEDRIMLDSYSDIKTHDERPEMRAKDIAKEVIDDMKSKIHDIIFTNICNCDMIGHTGNIPAIIKGVETIDKCLGEIIPIAKEKGYDVIITADHGNAEEKIDEKTNEILTSHSTNPVPFILISNYLKFNRDQGELQDIAPTILKLLGISQPAEMTGKSLI